MAYLTDEEIERRDDARSHAIDMSIEEWERKNAPGRCCGCAFLEARKQDDGTVMALCVPHDGDERDPYDLSLCLYHGDDWDDVGEERE